MSTYQLLTRPRMAGLIGEIVQHEICWDNTVSVLAQVDATEMEAVRKQAAKNGQPKPSYTAFVIKALATALQKHPHANRRLARRWWLPWGSYCYQQFHTCDISVGVERDLKDAECVAYQAMIRNAEQLTLSEITAQLHELNDPQAPETEQWKAFHSIGTRLPNSLAGLLVRLPYAFPSLWSRYRGGAAMVSSPGKYGADVVVGTWAAPIGISMGHVRSRPVVRAGQVVPALTFHLSMNFDRRLLAGGPAGRFFAEIVRNLEQPTAGQSCESNAEKLERIDSQLAVA